MAHYLAIEHADLDYGTKEIYVYVNKRSGIFWVDTIYLEEERLNMEFTDVIKEVYKAIPKSIGSSIVVEKIYRR